MLLTSPQVFLVPSRHNGQRRNPAGADVVRFASWNQAFVLMSSVRSKHPSSRHTRACDLHDNSLQIPNWTASNAPSLGQGQRQPRAGPTQRRLLRPCVSCLRLGSRLAAHHYMDTLANGGEGARESERKRERETQSDRQR